MTSVIIIQARMGSTRLPGKVLKNLSGTPVLWHVINRVKRSALSHHIIIATTINPEDDAIEAVCKEWDVPVFRGDPKDVLKRFCDAVIFMEFETSRIDYIVRITGDCPLIDPAIIDQAIGIAQSGEYDYVSNTDPPTFPDGLDVEVISRSALFSAWKNGTLPSEHEHVTPFIRKNKEFRKYTIKNTENLSGLRWTLDNEEDYIFIRKIYEGLFPLSDVFSMQDILNYLKDHPNLKKINEKIPRNEGYKKSLREDSTIQGEEL
jgi:spore coat polysaccharide biosynthesis protein SpsF (cytidylyltransferase family)